MQPITAFFNKNVTIAVRYSDQYPPITMDAFKIKEIDETGKPMKSVKVLNVTVTAVGNFSVRVDAKHTMVITNFIASVTFVPETIGKFQLFFVILEHSRKYTRDGPTFKVVEQCEYARSSFEKTWSSFQ